jgi:hypothetical protein
MAVRAIRKISSWTLYAVVFINIAVFGLLFAGGEGAALVENMWNPAYMDTLLVWIYILLAICAASMLLFGITQFFNKLKTNPKSSLLTLGIFIGFGLLLFLTYTLGDDTPFPMSSINADTRQFNVEFWLRMIDMWIFSVYILIGISICVILLGSIKKSIGK